MNLFGRHRLALDDRAHAVAAGDVEDDGAGFVACARPVDVAAEAFDIPFKLDEIMIEMVDGVLFDGAGAVAQGFAFG